MSKPVVPIQFRYAHVQDAESLARFYTEVHAEKIGLPDSVQSPEEYFQDKYQDFENTLRNKKNERILLALKDNKLVGFADYEYKDANHIQINDFYAREKTGSALHKKLLMSENVEHITLFATRSAVTAYERWGYSNNGHNEMTLEGNALQQWRASMPKQYPRFTVNYTHRDMPSFE